MSMTSISHIFLWLDLQPLSSGKKKMVDLISTLWLLWSYQNDVVFGGKKYQKQTIFNYIRDLSFFLVQV